MILDEAPHSQQTCDERNGQDQYGRSNQSKRSHLPVSVVLAIDLWFFCHLSITINARKKSVGVNEVFLLEALAACIVSLQVIFKKMPDNIYMLNHGSG